MDFLTEQLSKLQNDLIVYEDKILIDSLEKRGINIDWIEEKERRFKRITSEIQGDNKRFYYNDGSINGLLLVTIVLPKFDISKGKISFDIKYF